MRPNITRNPVLASDQRNIDRCFDTGAFAAPAFFTFGNSPRSGLRGPNQITTDFTMEKPFQITERIKFDLRAEFYNALNRANFKLPNRVFGGPGFGAITSADLPRRVQLAARISF
jgi:hypothetical protein